MTPQIKSGIGARLQKDTSAAVRCLSSDAKGYRCTGDTSNPRYGIKNNNKALKKVENLKGLLGYPTCKHFRFTSAILKIEDEKIC